MIETDKNWRLIIQACKIWIAQIIKHCGILMAIV